MFRNRTHAGRVLAGKLRHYADRPDVLVLALPRGGVPVAFEVAQALHAPLDVLLVRKLGVPGQEELALGALASGGVTVLDSGLIRLLNISEEILEGVVDREQRELERRERAYRDDRPAPDVRDHSVIVIDDGLATGSTMRAAIAALRKHHPARLVVAVPVGAPSTCAELTEEVDEVVCARRPAPFRAVGPWYEDFSETTDAEVCNLLQRAADNHPTPASQQA